MKRGIVVSLTLIGGLIAGFFLVYWPLPGLTARAPAGERMTVDADGHTLVAWVQGSGPRVVLAASLGREASDFNELTSSLVEAGYRTVAVEAPGINGASLREKPSTLYQLADDVQRIVRADAEAVGDAPVAYGIGHAFGNRVIRAAAESEPDMFPALVLIASGGKHAVPEKAGEALIACFDPRLPSNARLEKIRFAFFAGENEIPDYWRRGWHSDTARLQAVATSATPDTEWLAGGEGPVLVVQGVDDRIAPQGDAADELRADYPDRVQVAALADAGHALLPEQPELIARLVLDFLAEQQAAPSNESGDDV